MEDRGFPRADSTRREPSDIIVERVSRIYIQERRSLIDGVCLGGNRYGAGAVGVCAWVDVHGVDNRTTACARTAVSYVNPGSARRRAPCRSTRARDVHGAVSNGVARERFVRRIQTKHGN